MLNRVGIGTLLTYMTDGYVLFTFKNWLASSFGFPVAFGSVVVFMLIFLARILLVVDRLGYKRLLGAIGGVILDRNASRLTMYVS